MSSRSATTPGGDTHSYQDPWESFHQAATPGDSERDLLAGAMARLERAAREAESSRDVWERHHATTRAELAQVAAQRQVAEDRIDYLVHERRRLEGSITALEDQVTRLDEKLEKAEKVQRLLKSPKGGRRVRSR